MEKKSGSICREIDYQIQKEEKMTLVVRNGALELDRMDDLMGLVRKLK